MTVMMMMPVAMVTLREHAAPGVRTHGRLCKCHAGVTTTAPLRRLL